MSDEFVNKIVIESIFDNLSPERKEEIVFYYIRNNVHSWEIKSKVTSIVTDYIERVVREKITDRKEEIEKITEDSINSQLLNKSLIDVMIEKYFLRRAANKILK